VISLPDRAEAGTASRGVRRRWRSAGTTFLPGWQEMRWLGTRNLSPWRAVAMALRPFRGQPSAQRLLTGAV